MFPRDIVRAAERAAALTDDAAKVSQALLLLDDAELETLSTSKLVRTLGRIEFNGSRMKRRRHNQVRAMMEAERRRRPLRSAHEVLQDYRERMRIRAELVPHRGRKELAS